MITWFSEQAVNRLFYFTIVLFIISTAALYYYGFSLLTICCLLSTLLFLLPLYPVAKKNFSDYLYYLSSTDS
jgi:hypothetical protein